ncbi:MAG: hypothetical protein KDD02_19965 [Phaeodactylibacter sp.]|nr:hypothetical protein [Phaeodactylibacter sp.]MCB9299795.1 hypothetical protein [Lewinellaceae bacterium]
MKYLLYLLISGFALWIGSEILEIIQGGYSPAVYYMTAAYHILAGFGIWSLHLLQAGKKNNVSLTATILISLTYFALAYFPIQVMQSGLSVSAFIAANPIYKIPGLISLAGFVLFGLAIIKTRYFPAWTGVAIILCTIIYGIAMAKQLQLVVNINNIILSIVIIYIGVLGIGNRNNLQQ